MPPKDKTKGRKGDHATPELHPHVLRSRKQRRVKAEKEFAKGIKKLKKKGKDTKSGTSPSTNSETSVMEPFQYATSGEESEIQENFNPSDSSINEPGTSYDSGQDVSKHSDFTKIEQETTNDCSSAGEKFPKSSRQKMVGKTDDKSDTETDQYIAPSFLKNCSLDELKKLLDAKLRMGALLESGVEKIDQERTLNSRRPVTRSSTRGKTLLNTKPEITQISNKLASTKKSEHNIASTGKDISQNVLLNYSYDAKLCKDNTKNLVKDDNKESSEKIAEKELLEPSKPIKSPELTETSTHEDFPKVEKKTSEYLTNRKKELERKIEIFQSEMKLLDKQKKSIIPKLNQKTINESEMAITGDISVVILNKLDKTSQKKCQNYSYYIEDKRTVCLGDENVKISIVVNEGSQIICNSRRQPIANSDDPDNSKSCSETMESQYSAHFDKNITSDTKHGNETVDSMGNLSRIVDFPSRISQTQEDDTNTKPRTAIVTDSNDHDKNIPVAKSKKASEFFKKNGSFRGNRLEENVKSICDDFLKGIICACESFETRVLNHIEGDSTKSSQLLKK